MRQPDCSGFTVVRPGMIGIFRRQPVIDIDRGNLAGSGQLSGFPLAQQVAAIGRVELDTTFMQVLACDLCLATAQFGEFIQKIRSEGFNPQYLQHAREFDLTHPDSFITYADEESQDHLHNP